MTGSYLPPGLSDHQLRFVEEYCVDLAPAAAARRAACPNKNASFWAREQLANPEVKQAIDIRLQELSKQSIVSAEWVRVKLKEMVERCMQDVPVMVKKGDEMVESGEYKFDSNGANKSLELLGKHIGMFKDLSVVTIETELKSLTTEQLELRRAALLEEHRALDMVQNGEGVFELAAEPEKPPMTEEEIFAREHGKT